MTKSVYKVVCVTTLDYGKEWMVIRTDHFSKSRHVTPQGFFKSREEAETFVKEIDNNQ